MHRSVFNATPEELLAAGWGNHERALIPADWKTRRGPDDTSFDDSGRVTGARKLRRTAAEVRAAREQKRRAWTEEVAAADRWA